MPLKFFASDGDPKDYRDQLESLTVAGDAGSLRLLADFIAKAADQVEEGRVTMKHLEFLEEPGVKSRPTILPQVFVSRCV